MKKYIKEIIISVCQLFMFFIFPFFGGPTDGMGVVVVIIFATFALSLIMGALSDEKLKYLYPAGAAIAFLPTVMLHYNTSATVHALWYSVISAVGIAVGSLIKIMIKKIRRR